MICLLVLRESRWNVGFGGSLLIVEDESVLSRCLARHFESEGVDVVVAESLSEARTVVGADRFDACLLDVGLPDGDGLSLLPAIGAERSIVITANPDSRRLASAGVRHLLPKPLDLDQASVLVRLVFDASLDADTAVACEEPDAAAAMSRDSLPRTTIVESLEGESDAGARDPIETAHPALRIMLYSHDTVGHENVRRNLLIASELAKIEPTPHVLLLSDATESTVFEKPEGVQVMALPGLPKPVTKQLGAPTLGLPLPETVSLRSSAILAATESFQPDLVVIDNLPQGVERELEEALRFLRRESRAHVVLGLRDVLDEPAAIAREWGRRRNEESIARYFDAIWVYGDRTVLDLGEEYGFSDAIRKKIAYMGYLDRRRAVGASPAASFDRTEPYALCLVGGGEDGAALARAFVEAKSVGGLRRLLVLEPFAPDDVRSELLELGRDRPDLDVIGFGDETVELVRDAACVISMGDHNTVSEILSFGKRALIVPRVRPRREQWIRARRLAAMGLVDVCEPDSLSARQIEDWIEKAFRIRDREPARLDLGGLYRVRSFVEWLSRRGPEGTKVDQS